MAGSVKPYSPAHYHRYILLLKQHLLAVDDVNVAGNQFIHLAALHVIGLGLLLLVALNDIDVCGIIVVQNYQLHLASIAVVNGTFKVSTEGRFYVW